MASPSEVLVIKYLGNRGRIDQVNYILVLAVTVCLVTMP